MKIFFCLEILDMQMISFNTYGRHTHTSLLVGYYYFLLCTRTNEVYSCNSTDKFYIRKSPGPARHALL
jgi:hypothetical protein